MYYSNLSLIIASCQSYSDLWSNNLLLLDKNWPNHPQTFLISDGRGLYDLVAPKQLLIINGNMTNRIIESLKMIQTEYIVFSLDDYFITKKVNVGKIDFILNYMMENGIDYCGFSRNKHGRIDKIKNTQLSKLRLEHTYDVNLYLSIWKKDSLIKCLKADEDIWKAEVLLTKRFKKNNFKACCVLRNNIIPFIDIIRKGKYIRYNYHFLKKNKLFISNRKIQTVGDVLKLQIKTFLSKCVPNFIKKRLKKVYRKNGGIIYSDYANDEENK